MENDISSTIKKRRTPLRPELIQYGLGDLKRVKHDIACGLQLTQNTTNLTIEEQDDIVNGKEEEVVVLEKKHEIVK